MRSATPTSSSGSSPRGTPLERRDVPTFRLGRPDVLPLDDYSLRKAYMKAFRKRTLPSPQTLEKHGEKWRPYRTVASWYLWRTLNYRRDDNLRDQPNRRRSTCSIELQILDYKMISAISWLLRSVSYVRKSRGTHRVQSADAPSNLIRLWPRRADGALAAVDILQDTHPPHWK